MAINFIWSVQTSTVSRDILESKIQDDISTDETYRPCHPGLIAVHFLSTDPLEHTINGTIKCSCGRALGNFSGASDGSTLTYS